MTLLAASTAFGLPNYYYHRFTWLLYTATCISQHPQLRTGGFGFYCLHALAYGNWHILIMQKMLEFSSTVLPASPYCRIKELTHHSKRNHGNKSNFYSP